VNYTARPPAKVDDRAFCPDTASVEKVPPVGENAGVCSTFFAMRTRLVRLIKYGDQVVLYTRRKDERDRIVSPVESLATRLVRTEEGEEPQQPQEPHLEERQGVSPPPRDDRAAVRACRYGSECDS